MWQGNKAAPEYKASWREVLRRANGACERCGRARELVVHHRYRVQWREIHSMPITDQRKCKRCVSNVMTKNTEQIGRLYESFCLHCPLGG